MNDLRLTNFQRQLAKVQPKLAEVVHFCDGSPTEVTSHLEKNLWTAAHAGVHIAYRAIVRIIEMQATACTAEQMPLFDEPSDRLRTVQEMEEWFKEIKTGIMGGHERDDTGRGDWDEAQGSDTSGGGLARMIKEAIPQLREELGDPTWYDVAIHLNLDPDNERFIATTWAMIHTGELGTKEGGLLVAVEDPLRYDIAAMLEEQPGLGTELGLMEGDQIRLIELEDDPRPALADQVAALLFPDAGLSYEQLCIHLDAHGQGSAGCMEAVEWLVDKGELRAEKVNASDSDQAPVTVFYPALADVDTLEGDVLREAYLAEVGKKPGNKKATTLRAAIREAREEASAVQVPATDEQE